MAQPLKSICQEAGLRPREAEALTLVASGLDEQAVADQLGVSLSTVRVYLCLAKKRIRDREAEVQRARKVAEMDAWLDAADASLATDEIDQARSEDRYRGFFKEEVRKIA